MHGPKPRSHAFKLNKKVRRLGLKIALYARAVEGRVSHYHLGLCIKQFITLLLFSFHNGFTVLLINAKKGFSVLIEF